ncbi:Uncharacterised protein [Mycobacterium tuberculosis]|nr:Uncharacterised protein [Mycobacterium tuberculosis]
MWNLCSPHPLPRTSRTREPRPEMTRRPSASITIPARIQRIQTLPLTSRIFSSYRTAQHALGR